MTFGVGSGGQAGDMAARDVAGRDVYQGLSGEQLREIMKQNTEFYMTLVGAYERQATEQTRQLGYLRTENDMWRAGEKNAREIRQSALDVQLFQIKIALAGLAGILALIAWRLWPALTAAAALIAQR